MFVMINAGFGGFRPNAEALEEYERRTGRTYEFQYETTWHHRTDRTMINVIRSQMKSLDFDPEKMRIRILEIPAHMKFTIMQYDGFEWIAEVHRVWTTNGSFDANGNRRSHHVPFWT
jgi:hypothetical protein